MRLVLIALLCLPVIAQDRDARLYNASLVALVAANAVDVHSSWGHVEANPILGSRRQFDAQSAAIKGGIVGGLVLVQWLIAKKHPGIKRSLAKINFAVAGGVGAVGGAEMGFLSGQQIVIRNTKLFAEEQATAQEESGKFTAKDRAMLKAIAEKLGA